MGKISSGIKGLDNLVDSLYIGDNVVWEVDAGTASHLFIQSFIEQALADSQKIIYVSFNTSPQSILNNLSKLLSPEHFILIDCFTSGKGKNDNTFLKFYETASNLNIVRINNPKSIEEFTHKLNSLEDSFSRGVRYVFDSLTGMQDLWGNENETYKFFTYMCPRLYDLGTVAYWLLEKDAHSQSFKANLRHITQVVFDLYKRRDKLYIKALKLEGRQDREAFKPHLYEIEGRDVTVTFPKRELATDVGGRIKDVRTRLGISQKELADKVDLTPSFISQLENNQISPSLNSFIQICNALGVNPSALLLEEKSSDAQWLIKKEKVFSNLSLNENGLKGFSIVKNGNMSSTLIVLEPYTKIERNFISTVGTNLIYVLKGNISVVINGKGETLSSGDSIYLKEEVPSLWKNEGGDKAELLLLCS